MPLGLEVGLGPGEFVFDGDPAAPRKRAHPPHPIFGPSLLWPRSPILATAEILLDICTVKYIVRVFVVFNFCSLYQVICLSSRKSVNKYLHLSVHICVLCVVSCVLKTVKCMARVSSITLYQYV